MNKMINTETDALIEYSLCPEISDVKFADGLEKAFDTINDNFKRLANHDFIKGESGTSVYIKQEPIYNDDSKLSNFGKLLQDYLESLINPTEKILNSDSDGITLDYFGNFTPENAGSLQVIYNKSNDITADDVAVSSLQYVFLDGRFWNDKVGKVDQSIYDEIEDKSCIVIYNGNGKFESLNGALPTMYYEYGVGLCWKLNGKPTGMSVQGIPGKDGKNALMRIVKVNSLSTPENFEYKKGDVTHVFESLSGYIPIDSEDIDINDYADSSALIIENSGKFYIGSLGIENRVIEDETLGESRTVNILVATCDPNASLNDVKTSQDIHDAFKKININGSSSNPKVLQGLFIPIKNEEEGVQPVHLISASSIINTSDITSSDSANDDVIFTPIKNIDDLHPTEENPLNIEKYLYVRLDKEYNKVMSSLDVNKKPIGESLSKYNYCIKYKLVHIAKDKNDEYLKPSDDITNIDKYNFGYTVNSEGVETLLTTENVIYKIKDTTTDNYQDTLPNDLDSHPFYVWERQISSADYDIDELEEFNEYGNIPAQFNFICTKTFTPGISSDIYWFNALDIIDEFNDRYIVRGWSNDDFDMFKIIKFVPVFKDENYHVYDDTAVNFNYNVNITGCDHVGANSRRNLTVHGDINCENINVYRLTATGEIDNIYTKQDIVGDFGLMLSKDQDGNYMFEIDSDGNISGKTLDISGQINASTVVSNGLIASTDSEGNAGVVQTNSLQIVDKDLEDCMSFDASNGISNIQMSNTNNIKIEKCFKLSDDQKYLSDEENSVSKITTNTPIIACNNSSINVSDISIDKSDSVFVDENISKELYEHFSKIIDEDSSDTVKKAYYKNIVKGLKDAPNSYAVVKEVLKYKLESSTCFIDTSFKLNPKYTIYKFDDNTNGIYYYNPRPATSQKIKFRATPENATKEIASTGYACKFEIKHKDTNKFNPKVPIVITPAKMSFNMGLYSHCDNGTWTYFENSSCLRFRTIVRDSQGSLLYDEVSSEEYKFNNGNTQWKGGKTESGASISNENYETWRFKSFEVNPYKITINDPGTLQIIEDKYNNDSLDIIIYVYPEFDINISWKNNKYPKRDRKVADDCKIFKFVSIGSSSSSKTISEKSFVVRKNTSLPQDNFSKITYNLFVDNSSENINNTVLCKDGLLISSVAKDSNSDQSNKYLFGIGIGRHYIGNDNWIAKPEICYGKLGSKGVELKNLPIETIIEKLLPNTD